MTAIGSDPFPATDVLDVSVRRLGERTCVVDLGTELRHLELPLVDDVVRALVRDECRDLVFDLTCLRRYETFALVRLTREWDQLVEAGCAIHVAAREPGVVGDLERLERPGGWMLHRGVTQALRALLSEPVG
jgi:hypothetical protein